MSAAPPPVPPSSSPAASGGPRRLLVAGNWKMNGTRALARALAEAALAAARGAPEVDVAVFPPYPLLPVVAEVLGAPGGAVVLGGQACHAEPKGAHTSAVSAGMLVEVGCRAVLWGHSEVRREQGQSDAGVVASAKAGLEAGLRPLVCVGESQAEREAGRAREVLSRQVGAVVAGIPGGLGGLDVAYEPVWAIGTGRHATPEQAAEAHRWIRELLDAAPTRSAMVTPAAARRQRRSASMRCSAPRRVRT